jgi:hypothetical protein
LRTLCEILRSAQDDMLEQIRSLFGVHSFR